ncbi:MAG TPA: Ppx/GppA phosphatase family protein [Marmoricola sp.]|nr:Ppx/GppA phosphatase family protein [Marmoricola sp.]
MRLGVLDIGSNTGHLLVFDAHAGAAPMPASSFKEPLRLAEHLTDEGELSDAGTVALSDFVARALVLAEDKGCEEIYAFATSAVRDATNSEAVLKRVFEDTGAEIEVLPGDDEARLTFLAVRRWFGWSAGNLAVFDIGGGSLEMAAGADEAPSAAISLPLGAGRLTRDHLADHSEDAIRELRRSVRTQIARDAGTILRTGRPDQAAATSKTFRSLARICGAPPSTEGLRARRVLPADELELWIPKLAKMSHAQLSELPGVSPDRAHQLLAGALVASAVMDIFDLPHLEICPWALREGVVLERLDKLSVVHLR